eukprot:CAMPEP_0197896372 /NCGR_PEP_ID=MMETSP1439-20131203/39727_1 /TAXON_ID=66791 /ORGANISM="Gonyaulax spinifera, Strain CCMP409" /LENGTH=172 /DNA_ID=CAMNT_0043516891 /DNA_START=80 /DNA_END=598 /DNA_ORIENTATION=-
MANKMVAVGYDPVQRSAQWKRRVDREEITVCPTARSGSSTSSVAEARLDMLKQSLNGAGSQPSSSRLSSGPRCPSGLSAVSRSTAGAGRVIVQTPRMSSRGGRSGVETPMSSARGALSSRAGSIGPSASEAGSVLLRNQLEQEQQRRVAAEEEVKRLQTMLQHGGAAQAVAF